MRRSWAKSVPCTRLAGQTCGSCRHTKRCRLQRTVATEAIVTCPSSSSSTQGSRTTRAPCWTARLKMAFASSTLKATSLTPSPCFAMCGLMSPSPGLRGDWKAKKMRSCWTTCVQMSRWPVSSPRYATYQTSDASLPAQSRSACSSTRRPAWHCRPRRQGGRTRSTFQCSAAAPYPRTTSTCTAECHDAYHNSAAAACVLSATLRQCRG